MTQTKTPFLKAGHTPTLVAAFLYFDMSFMVWVMLGPLAVHIARDLALTPGEKGLMVALPVLAGALLRIPMGVLVDHLKPKTAGVTGQVVVLAGLAWAQLAGLSSFAEVLALGLVLGVAGASFAAALPLASRWYPPEHQGTALGIAGAGNSGTVFAALLAPGLAGAFGWQNVFGLATLPLAATLALYLALAKDSPHCPAPKPLRAYLEVLRHRDAWWFMFFYSVSFGGFVGLASSLTVYFNDQYALEPVTAGYFTAACVFAGSMVRPLGGYVADRVGGVRSLSGVYLVAAATIGAASLGLESVWLALAVLVAAMLALGMGNGAVFQLVPQRFASEIGVITGLVGMAGGVGGFSLASSLGYAKELTGSYQPGLLAFAALALAAFAALTAVKTRWRATWGAAHLTAARI
jgi:NNP family nitrate/nitrite transporter-like MFS transporter